MTIGPIRVKLLLFAAALALILLLAGRLWLIPARFSTDPNEGWNALQAMRAFGAGPLYPAPGGLTGNNYPPLSFYLVGLLARLTGDAIIAGRLVASTALAVVGGCVAFAIRRFTAPGGVAPAIGALAFVALNATLFRDYVAMNDPQWLAHALMTVGLCVLLPTRAQDAPGASHVVVAALAMVCGALVKHNLLALPAAATLWLLLHHRRAAAIWIGTGLVALALAAAACALAYGAVFFADLFAADRLYSAGRMLSQSGPFVIATMPLLIGSVRLLRRRDADSRIDLLLLAVAFALPLGAIEESGEGVDVNAFFEAAIALCIAGPVSLALAPARSLVCEPVAWLLFPLMALLPGTLSIERAEFADRTAEEAVWKTLTDRITRVHGDVACQMPAACYWSGKTLGIDFFLYGQQVLKHHDTSALAEALRTHRFAAIELEPADDAMDGADSPDPIAPLVVHAYHPVWRDEDGRELLVP